MITKSSIEKAVINGKPLENKKVSVESVKKLPVELRNNKAPSTSAMMIKIQTLINDIGTIDEAIENMISPQGKQALKMIKAVVKTINAKCVKISVNEKTGEIFDNIDYGKLFTSFSIEEIQGMQLSIASALGILSSTYSRAIAQSGLEYRTTKIAQEFVYSDAKSLLSNKVSERITEKMIEGYVTNNMIEIYINQVRNANLVEYLEVVFETSEMVRNVLQSLNNALKNDRINEFALMGKQ